MANSAQNSSSYFSDPDWSESLASQLLSIQNNLAKLGLRKQRYADTIQQAVAEGRLQAGQIERHLGGKLRSLQERLAEQGLYRSGALGLLSGQLNQDALVAHKQNKLDTESTVNSAQSQLQQVDLDTLLKQQQLTSLLQQESQRRHEENLAAQEAAAAAAAAEKKRKAAISQAGTTSVKLGGESSVIAKL